MKSIIPFKHIENKCWIEMTANFAGVKADYNKMLK